MSKIFVTGATGNVGQYLCQILAARGCTIHAITRDPTSKSAQKLADLGVVLFKGTFDDVPALEAAAQGCSAVFLNPSPDFTDSETMPRHARNIIDASKKAGIKACLYMSVTGAGLHDTFPDWVMQGMMRDYWLTKAACHDSVKNAGFDYWNILQPPTFMTNYSTPFMDMVYPGIRDEPVGYALIHNDPKTRISIIDPKNVAELCAVTLMDPARFHEQIFAFRSDAKTAEEIVAAISKATGKEIKVEYSSAEYKAEKAATDNFVNVMRYIDEMDSNYDYKPLEEFGIKPISFEDYLEREKESVMAAVAKN